MNSRPTFTTTPYVSKEHRMAKTKPKRKPRPRKPKQGYLDGMAPPAIPKIDKAR